MKVTITSCPNYYDTMVFLVSSLNESVDKCHSYSKGEPFDFENERVLDVSFYLDLLATGAAAEIDVVFNEARITKAITDAKQMKDVLEKRISFAQNIIQLGKQTL